MFTKLLSGDSQDSCIACTYMEHDDGTISGNRNCGRDAMDSMAVQCPSYQANGCFVASAVHEVVSDHKLCH